LLAAAGFACAPAIAALPDEIQVYTDDLEAPGERGIELHVNTTPSGNTTPSYPGEVVAAKGWRVTPEISWGLAPGWDWGLYLPFVHSGDDATWFAGPRFRLKWVPLRPHEDGTGSFIGINTEISLVQERFEQARRTMEIRPIIGYRGAAWLFSFNPILDVDLAGENKGVFVFAPAVKLSRTVWNRTALGAEYYANLGPASDFAPRNEQQHTLYVTLDTERVNFGIGRGLTNATDKWTVKAIFSF